MTDERRGLWAGVLVLGTLLATAPLAAAQTCGFPAGGTLSGVVNTYYAGVSTAADLLSITVDTSTRFPAANPAIAAGDMLLIVQMQEAAINANSSSRYGDGVSGAPAS